MRARLLLRAAAILIVLGALAAPALARKRVVLLAIEGKGGDDLTAAVEQVLAREVTVLSDGLFRRRQQRLRLIQLTDQAYARISADLLADAVVTGTWRSTGRRWRLTLVVRHGRTGAVVGRVTEVFRGRELEREDKEALAARLLPLLRDLDAPPGAADGGGDGDAPVDGAGGGDDGGDDGGADATDEAGPGGADDGGAASEDVATEDAATGDATPGDDAPGDDAAADDAWADDDGAGGIGPISGRTFAYVRAPVDGGDFQQVSASVLLSARPRFNDAASAAFELAFEDAAVALSGAEGLRVYAREAYVSLRRRGWLVRAGHQIQPWGASDVVNPTDFLTARDYRFFAADPEHTRRGALALLLSHATPRLEVKLVVTPRFPASRVLIPTSALPAGVSLGEPEHIPAAVDNTEVAAKVKVAGGGWDVAVVGFRGWNHTPELELVSATDTELVLRHTHRRIVAAGLDASASVGKLVFRLEASYVVPTDNADGADATRLPPVAAAVLGVERPLGQRLRAQAQLLARAYPQWTDPATVRGPDDATTAARRGLAASNALLLDYQDAQRPAATLRLAYQSEEGRLEAEIFGAMNLVGRDFLVRPLIGWRPVEPVTLQVGVDVYGGPRDRPLGALEDFGGAFGQVTYVF